MYRGVGSCFGLVVAMALFGAAWWGFEIITGGHTAIGFAVAAVGATVILVGRKVRRTRRRAEDTAVRMRGGVSTGEVRIAATAPGRTQSSLDGRLRGVRDAKEAKRLAQGLGAEPAMIFSVKAGTDQRWIGGYREGVAEILPDANVEVAYAPQQGSTVV